ncbi:phage minor head protein [Nocardioides massiliensis]|uniref:SPP1 gp7 family putative phage head morphogenesis protein n=1 Tax=Nocardioides massiliensis TaxID=1325935 RepID=A0ABT9NK00_9ACTN|nr:phage minor head protein [Nocardioides massiliensis]MDP9820395.1 SPP1 gp7 family putative phage head morphogenesis protein [Nocardioides massiliensis]
MALTDRTMRVEQGLRRELQRVTDAQTRDLVRAWATAWDEVATELHDALLEQLVAGDRVTRAQLMRSTRLARSLEYIADRLAELAADAGVRITADLQGVIDTTLGAQASIIDSQLPPNAKALLGVDQWSRVDPGQLEAIVRRSTEQITSLAVPLAPEAYAAVRRELIRGVAAGANPRVTARRMVRRAEKRFNGGLHRALVIARTETLDAYRAAAQAAHEADTDVLAGWVWTAELDADTCPACWSMHGRQLPTSEPGPLGHQQCRCARVPVTRSWRALGFDIDDPPSLLPDGNALFAALGEDEQRRVLGAARFEAWRAGAFPMSAWAERRTTSGWRDSYVMASAPAGFAPARSLTLAS